MAEYDAIDKKSHDLHAVLIVTGTVPNTPDTSLYILWKPPLPDKILGEFGHRKSSTRQKPQR